MKKLYLLEILNKYYLNGLTEKVKISIKGGTLSVSFITTNKDLVGIINAPNIPLPDCEFGVYNTGQLLKLINITDHFITLQVEEQNKICTKLLISDNEYNLEYVLADLMLTPLIPTIEEPAYEIHAFLDKEFISKFVKARKSLDAEIFTVNVTSNGIDEAELLNFTLGGVEGYNNRISFATPILPSSTLMLETLKFPLNEFKEILDNNKDLTSCELFISEGGLMKLKFKSEDEIDLTYILIGKD